MPGGGGGGAALAGGGGAALPGGGAALGGGGGGAALPGGGRGGGGDAFPGGGGGGAAFAGGGGAAFPGGGDLPGGGAFPPPSFFSSACALPTVKSIAFFLLNAVSARKLNLVPAAVSAGTCHSATAFSSFTLARRSATCAPPFRMTNRTTAPSAPKAFAHAYAVCPAAYCAWPQ